MTLTAITPEQIAIICPTKDQPKKVIRLLGCIARSEVKPAQVLIADGGHNLEFIVKALDAVIKTHAPEIVHANKNPENEFFRSLNRLSSFSSFILLKRNVPNLTVQMTTILETIRVRICINPLL